jgi:hypothetical protein
MDDVGHLGPGIGESHSVHGALQPLVRTADAQLFTLFGLTKGTADSTRGYLAADGLLQQLLDRVAWNFSRFARDGIKGTSVPFANPP